MIQRIICFSIGYQNNIHKSIGYRNLKSRIALTVRYFHSLHLILVKYVCDLWWDGIPSGSKNDQSNRSDELPLEKGMADIQDFCVISNLSLSFSK